MAKEADPSGGLQLRGRAETAVPFTGAAITTAVASISRVSTSLGLYQTLNAYRLTAKLGQGQFGKVILGERMLDADLSSGASSAGSGAADPIASPTTVAVKCINRVNKRQMFYHGMRADGKPRQDDVTSRKIANEVLVMVLCRPGGRVHPHVVNLLEVVDDPTCSKMFMVLEYCRYGELRWWPPGKATVHLRDELAIRLSKVAKIAADVLLGLDFIHGVRVIHRDIKPSNLLLDASGKVKIGDFGVSVQVTTAPIASSEASSDVAQLFRTVGTPAFFPPELCQFINFEYDLHQPDERLADEAKRNLPTKNLCPSDTPVDVGARIDTWATGVLLYALFFHTLPFNGDNEFQLFKSIANDGLRWYNEPEGAKSADSDTLAHYAEFKLFLAGVLTKDTKTRATVAKLMRHPFVMRQFGRPSDRQAFLGFNDAFLPNREAPRAPSPTPVRRRRRFMEWGRKTEPDWSKGMRDRPAIVPPIMSPVTRSYSLLTLLGDESAEVVEPRQVADLGFIPPTLSSPSWSAPPLPFTDQGKLTSSTGSMNLAQILKQGEEPPK